ncbi:hypothetical protein IG631_00350 [Alternaria alternata]|nr:hypothetical protein IG631_00350 [Alternaria alternata]
MCGHFPASGITSGVSNTRLFSNSLPGYAACMETFSSLPKQTLSRCISKASLIVAMQFENVSYPLEEMLWERITTNMKTIWRNQVASSNRSASLDLRCIADV